MLGARNRFGLPVPKQYHFINGRPVIEYVIDAAIKSIANEVIVVTDTEKIDGLENKYSVTVIGGGRNCNQSIGNALSYISGNFLCEKITIVDAVCPMVRADLFDLYFGLLDKYDAVFTADEMTTSLTRKDNMPVNRRDYLLIESPDAYRFEILRDNFLSESIYTTPLHMLPEGLDIKYYLTVMYPHDFAIAEALMREQN